MEAFDVDSNPGLINYNSEALPKVPNGPYYISESNFTRYRFSKLEGERVKRVLCPLYFITTVKKKEKKRKRKKKKNS